MVVVGRLGERTKGLVIEKLDDHELYFDGEGGPLGGG